MAIQDDVKQTWHDAIIELFELDLSPITGNASDIYRFTSQTMPDGSKISFDGNEYEPFPIVAAGFETTTKGQTAQPELTVANVLGTLASVVNTYNDLVGARVIRRRTLLKYLDGSTAPDPSQEFPEDKYYIERKTSETNITITWTLASKIDLEGLQLPKRIVTQNYCLWKYRGSECGYNGPGIADVFDQPLLIGGNASPEAQAYASALQTFETKKSQLKTAEDKKNSLRGVQQAACDPDAAEVDDGPYFILQTTNQLGQQYTFGIDNSSGKTVVAVWNGNTVTVTGLKPDYRTDLKQKTGRSGGPDGTGTGATYALDEYILVSGQPQYNATYYSVEPGNASFAFKDLDNAYIGFFQGSKISIASSNAAGYRVGSARDALGPMRSIAKLDYAKNCSTATNNYQSALADYTQASQEYAAASYALQQAYAALPNGDAARLADQCGKRLSSCKLRFGAANSLPFGGFPAANIAR